MNAPTRTIASAVGITEGQAYTLLIGLLIGLVTAAIGIPPTLRDDRVAEAVRRALPGRESSAPTPRASEGAPAAAPESSPSPSPTPTAGALSAAPFVGSPLAGAVSATDEPVASADETPSTGEPAGPAYADGGPFGEVTTLASSVPRGPLSVAVDGATGAFYVGGENRVLRYSAAGTLEREYAVGGGASVVTDLVVRDGNLFATTRGGAEVLRIAARSGVVTEVATIPDVPTCIDPASRACELSPRNAPPSPSGLAFGPGGDLVVADGGQGLVWTVGLDGSADVWDRSADFVSDADRGPANLRFDGNRALVLAVQRSLFAMTGAVYRIPIGAQGPGTHEELFRSDPDAQPVGVAIGAGGRIYVTLSTAGTVVVLERDGAERARVASQTLGRPMGLAFRGRSLLVANQEGSVARVSVEDSGVSA